MPGSCSHPAHSFPTDRSRQKSPSLAHRLTLPPFSHGSGSNTSSRSKWAALSPTAKYFAPLFYFLTFVSSGQASLNPVSCRCSWEFQALAFSHSTVGIIETSCSGHLRISVKSRTSRHPVACPHKTFQKLDEGRRDVFGGSLIVISAIAPSSPHGHGRSSPNCTSFRSVLLMVFMSNRGQKTAQQV